MNAFEKKFAEKFPIIRKRIGAYLFPLYPPMRVGGMRGSMPCFVQTGRALFDVMGWLPASLGANGPEVMPLAFATGDFYELGPKVSISIGIELKETSDRHASMRIVGEDGSGSGIQAHQLEALAAVHRDGGIARVLWSNGGITAVLDGAEIAAAHYTYAVSVQAEKMRKKPALGSRSIPWKLFREVDIEAKPEGIILPPPRELTLAQSLKRAKRKAGKMIQEDEDAPVDPAVFDVDGDDAG